MRKSRVLNYWKSEGDKKLIDDPHVSLWRTSPGPSRFEPEKYQPNQDWYVALNWSEGPQAGGQIDLFDWHLYHQAYSAAIAWGKKLGIPVIKQSDILIWASDSEQTQEQREMVRDLMKEDKGACTL